MTVILVQRIFIACNALITSHRVTHTRHLYFVEEKQNYRFSEEKTQHLKYLSKRYACLYVRIYMDTNNESDSMCNAYVWINYHNL